MQSKGIQKWPKGGEQKGRAEMEFLEKPEYRGQKRKWVKDSNTWKKEEDHASWNRGYAAGVKQRFKNERKGNLARYFPSSKGCLSSIT